MPESTLKYYPVLARVQLLLNDPDAPIVSFRAAIVSHIGDLTVDYRLVHRFVTDYKGATHSCNSNVQEYVEHSRGQAMMYLEKKRRKMERLDNRALEPIVEIEIDLRQIMPAIVA